MMSRSLAADGLNDRDADHLKFILETAVHDPLGPENINADKALARFFGTAEQYQTGEPEAREMLNGVNALAHVIPLNCRF